MTLQMKTEARRPQGMDWLIFTQIIALWVALVIGVCFVISVYHDSRRQGGHNDG
jgi:hypothetical protein